MKKNQWLNFKENSTKLLWLKQLEIELAKNTKENIDKIYSFTRVLCLYKHVIPSALLQKYPDNMRAALERIIQEPPFKQAITMHENKISYQEAIYDFHSDREKNKGAVHAFIGWNEITISPYWEETFFEYYLTYALMDVHGFIYYGNIVLEESIYYNAIEQGYENPEIITMLKAAIVKGDWIMTNSDLISSAQAILDTAFQFEYECKAEQELLNFLKNVSFLTQKNIENV